MLINKEILRKTFRKKVSDPEFESLFRYFQFTISHYSELEETEAHPELIKRWRKDMVDPAGEKLLAYVRQTSREDKNIFYPQMLAANPRALKVLRDN